MTGQGHCDRVAAPQKIRPDTPLGAGPRWGSLKNAYRAPDDAKLSPLFSLCHTNPMAGEMSGFMRVANDALRIAAGDKRLQVAVMLLYYHADRQYWKPFWCADSWLVEHTGLTRRQARQLLSDLVEEGCVEIVFPGDRTKPRKVAIVEPVGMYNPADNPADNLDAHQQRVSGTVRSTTRTTTRTDLKQIPYSDSNSKSPNGDSSLAELWEDLISMLEASGHLKASLDFDDYRKRLGQARKACGGQRQGGAALRATLEYWLVGPNDFYREQFTTGATILKPLLRPTKAAERLPEVREWVQLGKPRKLTEEERQHQEALEAIENDPWKRAKESTWQA